MSGNTTELCCSRNVVLFWVDTMWNLETNLQEKELIFESASLQVKRQTHQQLIRSQKWTIVKCLSLHHTIFDLETFRSSFRGFPKAFRHVHVFERHEIVMSKYYVFFTYLWYIVILVSLRLLLPFIIFWISFFIFSIVFFIIFSFVFLSFFVVFSCPSIFWITIDF